MSARPWALRELVIFVHFGLFLASSRHLRSSLGTWQRSLKNWLNLPVETQACSRLLVFSDRFLIYGDFNKTVEKRVGVTITRFPGQYFISFCSLSILVF